jgi:superfamily I DNA/RNA helicase
MGGQVEAGTASAGGPLNSLQLEAAQADIHRPLLIQAAAGTGKTSTMIARVAHLLAQVGMGGRTLLSTC